MAAPFSKYFLVRPQDLNHAGTLFGGAMMALADEMAFIAATLTYPGATFVTKLFDEFDFISGPRDGEIVLIEAEVLKRGRSSVTVSVRAAAASGGKPIFQTTAILVNAKDGKSLPIPLLPGESALDAHSDEGELQAEKHSL